MAQGIPQGLKGVGEAPEPICGWLQKTSPTKWRQILPAFKFQKRFVRLVDARLSYTKSDEVANADADSLGVVDLISNECEVSSEGEVFTVLPKSGAWLTGTFTGADSGRVFEFDCAGTEESCAKWVEAIQKHIQYAMSVKLALLAKVPLVKRLPVEEHIKMAKACITKDYLPDAVIVREGEIGEEFFVIISGEASVHVGEGDEKNVIMNLKAGDYFGENALRQADLPRAATVIATSNIVTFQLKRSQFEELGFAEKLKFPNRRAVAMGHEKAKTEAAITPKDLEETQLISKALYSNQFLKTLIDLNDSKVKQLVDIARRENVPPGTTLIKEGDLGGESFYIVHEGLFEVEISVAAKEKSGRKSLARGLIPEAADATEGGLKIAPGGSFGELALLYLEPRAATIKSVEKSVVWVIDRQSFKAILMKVSDQKINEYVGHLKEVSSLACLLDEERSELARNLVEVQFFKGDLILEQGEVGSTFYVLYEGEVAVEKDGKEVKKLSASVEQGAAQYFGEGALLGDEKRAATIKVVSEEAKALAMDLETFQSVLGPLKDIIDRTKSEGKERKPWPGRYVLKAALAFKGILPEKPRESIAQEDLTRIGLLGCGGFGIVELMEHNTTRETYALKGLSKGFVVKAGMQKNVMNEKEIQISLSSAFIVKLFETYNSEQKLFFLLEPAMGGELYATYQRKGFHGSVKHAQFYVAGATLAFEHMHLRGMIYRDLKPENLLLTDKGNVKLTDMGLAKYVTGKTYTSCGTPDYFAPEIIKSAGHNKAVDWWELGILTFELMSGHPPFESDDPTQTYAMICNGIERVSFPLSCKGVVADLIKQLCKKQPSERLPMRAGGTNNVKVHPWFISTKFDWDAFRVLGMTPPYKPVVKSKKDLANFPDSVPNMPRQLEYKDDGSGWDKTFASAGNFQPPTR